MANWMKRSIFFTSFFSTQRNGSNPFTSQAKWVECWDASKSVIGPAPDLPASRPAQVSSVPIPRGDTSPTPVTTTLRFSANLLLALVPVLLDVVDRLAHAGDLLGILVGDLDAELLLEGHQDRKSTRLNSSHGYISYA